MTGPRGARSRARETRRSSDVVVGLDDRVVRGRASGRRRARTPCSASDRAAGATDGGVQADGDRAGPWAAAASTRGRRAGTGGRRRRELVPEQRRG